MSQYYSTASNLPIEILREICKRLISDTQEDWSRAGDKDAGVHTLLPLARTCRTLHHAALDALWHTLPSVAPLFWTLPRDLWQAIPEPGPSPHEKLQMHLVCPRTSMLTVMQ